MLLSSLRHGVPPRLARAWAVRPVGAAAACGVGAPGPPLVRAGRQGEARGPARTG